MQADHLSNSQIERWRLLYEEYKADAQQVANFKNLDERRTLVCQEMVDFLQQYLTGKISTKQFKETFDLKTRSQWSTFGLKGLSGGMFLNKIVNHVSEETALTDQLSLELHKRCAFFSEESLIQHAENIMRWANHPAAIENLALRVGDADS